MGEWNPDNAAIAMEREADMPVNLTTRQLNTVALVAVIEQVESAYLSAQIDHAEFAAQMREVDDKLAIVGLSLAIKPKANARV